VGARPHARTARAGRDRRRAADRASPIGPHHRDAVPHRRGLLRPRPQRDRPRLHAEVPTGSAATARPVRVGSGSRRVRAVAAARRRSAGDQGLTAGALVLVATPIGNLGDLSPRAVEALAAADVIACEDTRRTRKLLSHAGVRSRKLVAVHDHNEASMVRTLLTQLDAGTRVALVTDAA